MLKDRVIVIASSPESPSGTLAERRLHGTIAGVRRAVFAAHGGIGFLYAYMAFHALHVAGLDPSIMRHLAQIPLFSGALASAGSGVVTGILGAISASSASARDLNLARLPGALAIAVALFTIEIVLFP